MQLSILTRRPVLSPFLAARLPGLLAVVFLTAGCGRSGRDPNEVKKPTEAESKILKLDGKVRKVDGEIHVILTGWKGSGEDYGLVEDVKEAQVLLMANKDVTDDTLKHVLALKKLRELDVGDSKVTDKGLELLTSLEALQTLHLENTAVTVAAADRWKAAQPGRKYIR